MGKYEPLGRFLRSQPAEEVSMTFADIERVTGARLPPKAQHQRAWWSNNASNNVMTKVWLDAGFKSERVDLDRRRLVFRRVRKSPAMHRNTAEKPPKRKRGHHPLWGALKGMVQIVPGTDLTQPADPDWGKIWDEQ